MTRRPRRRVAKRRADGSRARPARRESRTVSPRARRLDNLPTQLTTFIGREREIAEVEHLLRTARLLTLTGSGGSGKTRLALQVAAGSLEHYHDGVWFVELAPLADAAFIPNSVAAALDVEEQPARPLIDTLADYLRAKSLLLVLDNCEHLYTACQRVADQLLRASPTVQILATSREMLGVDGESTYRVPPLRLPDAGGVPPVAQLAQYDAIRLFADRAALAQPGFTVTAGNAAAILQICQRLDGLPLALEFAAARVAALSVEQIAARLDDRFRLLTAGPKQALPRHQTLRATLDWSHDLLTEHEQAFFRRLAVFAGGFMLEAAEQVCAGTGIAEHDVLDLLTRLVNKSLVVFDERDGHARYRLRETVRQYARERLEESGDADGVQRRHRDWYLDFAERANAKLRGHEQDVWLGRLEAEHENLRGALAWSQAVRDAAATLRLAGALTWFWFMNVHWGEGRRWVEAALSAGGTAPPVLVFWARWGGILFALLQGDVDRGRELTSDMTAAPEGMNAKEFSTIVNIAKGNMAADAGEGGQSFLEEAVALAHELGDRWLLAFALSQMSAGVRKQGDFKRAAGLCAESVRLFEALGDRWRLSVALRNMGITLLCSGEYDKAAAAYAKSIRLRAPAHNRWIVYQDLEGLACIACAQGRYKRAAILFTAALTVQKSLQSRRDADFSRLIEHYMDRLRASLSTPALEAAENEGRAMGLEQALEYALGPAGSEKAAARRRRDGSNEALTLREREVARLVARGLTNREIAAALVVSERTAEGHVQSILNKLSFTSRAQIAAWAVERGLRAPQPRDPDTT